MAAILAASAASASAEDIAKTVAKGATAIAKGAATVAQQAVEAVSPASVKPNPKKKTAKKLTPAEPKVAAPTIAAPPVAAQVAPASGAPKDSDPDAVPEPKAAADATAKQPETWSPAEITDANARCAVILKKISAIAIPEAPIKEGACGAPAPIQLISIGKKPEVAISPPAIITCELAETLAQWIEGDLQPLAKKHLGAEIIKIENMSSYSCRNAYGRAHNKLSEHGVANALDIRGFTTAAGKTALVLEDWGTPQREILARIAAEKAAADKAEATRTSADKAAQANQLANTSAVPPGAPPAATGSAAGAPAAGIARSTIADGIPKLTVTLPGAKPAPRGTLPAFTVTEPEKLGGPKQTADATAALPGASTSPSPSQGRGAKSEFLHEAHAAACRIFGTTLGPEANEAHRNHFHVDMAARTTTKICD